MDLAKVAQADYGVHYMCLQPSRWWWLSGKLRGCLGAAGPGIWIPRRIYPADTALITNSLRDWVLDAALFA